MKEGAVATVNTDELRDALHVLLVHLERNGNKTIEIPWDYYWQIPREYLYDSADQPPELDLGQLSSDWEEVQRIGSGEMPPVSDALVWLAAVIRAIGDTVND